MSTYIFFRRFFIFTALVLLASCGVMDSILPSSVTYRVNVRINDIPIDEFSIISSDANIQPYFDTAVSGDPDVTALMVFFKDQRGEVAGWKVIYTIDAEIESNNTDDQESQQEPESDSNESTGNFDSDSNDDEYEDENEFTDEEDGNANSDANTTDNSETDDPESQQNSAPYGNGDELIIYVNNLDDDLPYFPIPSDLSIGRYTLVSQVMSGNHVLHKSEKTFFFLSNARFDFDAINVHHGGITENHQLISKGKVIMLEASLDFDSRLNPYIVWHNGKKIISEGSFSQGAGNLLWKAPEQTGFSSIRAEVFPVADRQGLAGFVKGISLLISSRTQNMHYISEDSPEILHKYLLEGDLNDARLNASGAGINYAVRFSLGGSSKDRALKKINSNPSIESSPARWMPANGIFGLAAGFNNAYTLPDISFSNNADNDNSSESWQIFSRFKPLSNGVILSVQFHSSSNVGLNLVLDGNKLILSLASQTENAFKIYHLSEAGALEPDTDSFVNAEINFSVLADRITAKLNIISENNFGPDEQEEAQPIGLETEPVDKYRITLGSQSQNAFIHSNSTSGNSTFTALWDELALIYIPYTEPETAEAENEESDESAEEEPANAGEAAADGETTEKSHVIAYETTEEAEMTEPEAITDSEEETQPEENMQYIAEKQLVTDDSGSTN